MWRYKENNDVNRLYERVKKTKNTEEKIRIIKKHINKLKDYDKFEYDLNYRIDNIILVEPFSIILSVILVAVGTFVLSSLDIKSKPMFEFFEIALYFPLGVLIILAPIYSYSLEEKSILLNIKNIFEKERVIK
ncbi:hypothetical protein J2Z35_000505 [Acetoanaerobium pronyense]|uniref:Uncharacterized protein n=1 Tax=Acetoanaerobium pronyense TaxID=1482736 RepID=A0ABS4KHW4_9FIRM|nr:hypothetical protein [Acetoanaerobium pronyense]MBP2026716.1 hypothetical protein [Acetoanaerobium pronyense]